MRSRPDFGLANQQRNAGQPKSLRSRDGDGITPTKICKLTNNKRNKPYILVS